METNNPSEKTENSYLADPEDLNEMARLISQDRALTGVIPQVISVDQWKSFKYVLDIGCGPGAWCLDMARQYPDCKFIGIDISGQMLTYARMLAQAENIENVEFIYMDSTKPLAFQNDYFDCVNARFIYSFLHPSLWPFLLQECQRILRPGGSVCFAEYEALFSNSLAYERLVMLLTQAALVAKRTFSKTGNSAGISAVMRNMMRNATFQEIEIKPYLIEQHPQRTEEFILWRDDALLITHTFKKFVIATQVASENEIQKLLEEGIQDMNQPDFSVVSFGTITHGRKKL